jgi:hypothetical protein
MSVSPKQEIITFKVDKALWTALEGVANRSEFIRTAILAALDSSCPLCRGTGMLTPEQRRHWGEFSKRHSVEQCEDCHAVRLVCVAEEDERVGRCIDAHS